MIYLNNINNATRVFKHIGIAPSYGAIPVFKNKNHLWFNYNNINY
jgi:hypothetical protein